MKRFVWLPVFLTVLLAATVALGQGVLPGPVQDPFDKDSPIARFPDLDQNRDYTGDAIPETKWCAPTAAANSVWYFGNAGYPELIPNVGNNTQNADALITSLGNLMGTSDAAGGTTIGNCVAGLQGYFNANTTTPFSVNLVTAWTFPIGGQPSAQNMWNFMCTELEDCQDVLPVIWLPGPEGHNAPPEDDSQIDFTELDSIGGHLVTMTAYNWAGNTVTIHDPDDMPVGTGHFFPAVPAASKVTWNLAVVGAPQGTALSINGGAGGWIVGAIIACPIPEPSILLLVVPGLGLLALRRRKK